MGARYVGAEKWRLAAAIARRTAGGRATTTSGRQSGKARILQVLLLNSRASSWRTAYTEIANMNKSEVKLAELRRFGHTEIINALKMLTPDPKGRHYTERDAAAWAAVILGGGWSGNWSLRRSSSSVSSGSGCV